MGGLFHNLRHPRRCYVVCAIPRSGSNLLTDGLHATRRAGRPKQFFLPKYEAGYTAAHRLDASRFSDYVRGIVALSATSNEMFGFKLMSFYLKDFLARLRATGEFSTLTSSELELLRAAFPRLQFIRIIRRDKLRQAISKARATQTGLWKVVDGGTAASTPQFDAELIRQCIRDGKRDEAIWARFFETIGVSPFIVEYESLCHAYEETLAGVLEFLGIRWPRNASIQKPITMRQSDPISDEWERRCHQLAMQLNEPLTY